MVWRWVEAPWQYRVLDALEPGVDAAQLEQALAKTPTERVDSVVELLTLADDLQAAMRKTRGNT